MEGLRFGSQRKFSAKKKRELNRPATAELSQRTRSWPQFRGPTRDGRVPWLPSTLPDQQQLDQAIVWEAYLPSSGVGGIAATEDLVIVGSRDATDQSDLFQGFNAKDGALVWKHATPARGRLDYGNSPRATPLIIGPAVYTLGAFGNLSCVDIESGIPLWQKHLTDDLGGKQPEWGYSGSPLAAGENIIVHPGGESGMALLDGISGKILKRVAGQTAAYASPTRVRVGKQEQILGIESRDIVGWNLEHQQERWRLRPKSPGDFGVPTPVTEGRNLYLTSEGNGTRRHEFRDDGSISDVLATNPRLAPDSYTPLLTSDHFLIVHNGLWALDKQTLKTNWSIRDRTFVGYASVLATESRLLALTENGELILVAFDANAGKIVGKLALADKKVKTLSHPALVGSRLYAQIGQRLICLELGLAK